MTALIDCLRDLSVRISGSTPTWGQSQDYALVIDAIVALRRIESGIERYVVLRGGMYLTTDFHGYWAWTETIERGTFYEAADLPWMTSQLARPEFEGAVIVRIRVVVEETIAPEPEAPDSGPTHDPETGGGRA